MPEQPIISQEKGKPLVAEKEYCAVNLNIALADFEAKQLRNFYSEDAFEMFFVHFRRLVTITQHEKSLLSIKYGKFSILEMVHRYFRSDVRNNYNFGIKIARAYLKTLFEQGILSNR
jgi:hypothetical protein